MSNLSKVISAVSDGMPMQVWPYKEPKVWGVNGIGEYWYGAESGDKSSIAVVAEEKAPLDEIVKAIPEEVIGKLAVAKFGNTLPLVKILTPKGRLSVQFHDKKNELWIVTGIDVSVAGKTPWVIAGFSRKAINKFKENVTAEYRKVLEEYGKKLNGLIDLLEEEGTKFPSPFAETDETVLEVGADIPGVTPSESEFVFSVAYGDFGTDFPMAEMLELHNHTVKREGTKVALSELFKTIGKREYSMRVEEGAFTIELPDGTPLLNRDTGETVVFSVGQVLNISERGIEATIDGVKKVFSFEQKLSTSEFMIVNVTAGGQIEGQPASGGPVKVRIDYEKTPEEKLVYAVHETVKKNLPAILGKRIDIVLPEEMFLQTKGGEGSEQEMQKLMTKIFGHVDDDSDKESMVRIVTYKSLDVDNKPLDNPLDLEANDLKNVLRSSKKAGRIAVLGVTEKGLNDAKADADLVAALSEVRNMALPDMSLLNGNPWYFSLEVVGLGLLQAALNTENITQSVGSDILNLMHQMANPEITLDDLYYMLPFAELEKNAELKDKIANGTKYAFISWIPM